MLTIEKLRQFGANTEEGLNRCVNMTDFYLELVKTAIKDDQLFQLEKAICENDLGKAFEIAHALKGVYGNLALTPLYEPLIEMTELLRSRTQTDYAPLLTKAETCLQTLREFAESDG